MSSSLVCQSLLLSYIKGGLSLLWFVWLAYLGGTSLLELYSLYLNKHQTNTMPISICSLNNASRNMIRLNVTSKSHLSYTALRRNAMEQRYYEANHGHQAIFNHQAQTTKVNNNGGGQVESSNKTFIKNSHTSNTSVSDVDDGTFVPTVSSESNVSGIGHSKI